MIADPTTDYARAVVAGEIVAGRLVRLACQRHLDDLDHGAERGLHFDLRSARRVMRFFRLLRHAEGQFAGKPFELMPFQQFIVGSVFGWKKANGQRRFRTAYAEIGKGGGKTPLAAGVGLYGLVADGEMGAQIYSAAVSRDQANLSFTDAVNMAEGSPEVAEQIEFNVGNMAVLQTKSFFRPLSSEHRGKSGQRVHMAIVDELHEHSNAKVVDKISAGTKGRLQSLILEITNSGFDPNSVCYHHHDYSVKVLTGVLADDEWFAYVCQLDPCAKCEAEGRTAPNENCKDCDDWRDERVWIKANPGVDVIIGRDYLRKQVKEAVGMPSKENIVRQLNFCQWTEQAVRWIPMADWSMCAGPLEVKALAEKLRGRACFGGLDLSSKIDLTAFVKVFSPIPSDPFWYWLCRFFVPRENVLARENRDRVPYSSWIRAGLIEATEGNVVDYDVIRKRIEEDGKLFSMQEIGFDPWNATQLATQLIAKGFKMVEVRQGTASMSEPAKELEALVRSHLLVHGGNAVLRWNASNVAVRRDGNDNLMPDKERSIERIDGIVAGLIAMSRAIRNRAAPFPYHERGILTL